MFANACFNKAARRFVSHSIIIGWYSFKMNFLLYYIHIDCFMYFLFEFSWWGHQPFGFHHQLISLCAAAAANVLKIGEPIHADILLVLCRHL
jgi:hypothetical protein